MPKTFKEQKQEFKKTVKGGQVSIKISKPKLTINGFELNHEEIEKRKRLTEKMASEKPESEKIPSVMQRSRQSRYEEETGGHLS